MNRTLTYTGITFRTTPIPPEPDPLRDLLSAVKALPADRALAVTCLPAQLNAVKNCVYALGCHKSFKHHTIHTRATGSGQFVVWTTPRRARRNGGK